MLGTIETLKNVYLQNGISLLYSESIKVNYTQQNKITISNNKNEEHIFLMELLFEKILKEQGSIVKYILMISKRYINKLYWINIWKHTNSLLVRSIRC